MSFRYSLLAGPGHHDALIANVLKEQEVDFLQAKYFPEFSVTSWRSGKEAVVKRSQLYNAYTRLIWGLSTRIPLIRSRQWHLLSTFSLYDRLAAGCLLKGEALLAWPQVSLQTIKRFKSAGKKIWLEYPMIHFRAWQEIMLHEYERWETSVPHRKSIFPKSMLDRMQTEVEFADHINVLSSYAAGSFRTHGVPQEKLSITLPGVDHEFYSPAVSSISGKIIFMYAGRLELLKGVPYLLEAFRQIDPGSAELWLVGAVSEEIKPFIRSVPANIRILGTKGRVQLRDLYRQAHVLVLPSVQESFGLVMLEAMACGLPVIASAQTGAPDVLTHGQDGFVLKELTVGELHNKLSIFLEDRLLHLDMGKRARKRVEQNFTIRHFAQRFVASLGEAGL